MTVAGAAPGQPRLYRAPLVLPMTAPPLADGGVLVAGDGVVRAVAPYRELAGLGREEEIDGVILPGLVNGHAHLELSVLGEAVPPAGNSLAGWIETLLARRAGCRADTAAVREAGRRTLADFHAQGITAVLDVGNLVESAAIGDTTPVSVSFLWEQLGLGGELLAAAQAALATGTVPVTAHAPYSCAPELLAAIKGKARAQHTVFSIHLAESAEEVELLARGRGPMVDFLVRRGVNAGAVPVPGLSAARYLDRLGILDGTTVCVHCVHLDETEVELLARRGCAVVLCPTSNRHIGVGTAPLETMLAHKILPGLGTDSLASNPHLSLWHEMAATAQTWPAVDPATILAMACRGGARALAADHLGRIGAGVRADTLLAVTLEGDGWKDPLAALVHEGGGYPKRWLV